MVDGAVLKQWAENMLLEWHFADPVSQKEIDRNNAVHDIQNNRNPFIDNPVYVEDLYGVQSIIDIKNALKDLVKIYPNPVVDKVNVEFLSDKFINQKYEIINVLGGVVNIGTVKTKSLKIDLSEFDKGIYFLQVKADETTVVKKLVVK